MNKDVQNLITRLFPDHVDGSVAMGPHTYQRLTVRAQKALKWLKRNQMLQIAPHYDRNGRLDNVILQPTDKMPKVTAANDDAEQWPILVKSQPFSTRWI